MSVKRRIFPGVDAYWLTTPGTGNGGPVLIYTHGGAYVGGSGKELPPAVLMIANESWNEGAFCQLPPGASIPVSGCG